MGSEITNEYKEELTKHVNKAYTQRMLVVRLLAVTAGSVGFSFGIGKDNNEHWDDEWRNVIYIDLPHGQFSWHIAPHDLHLFSDFPPYKGNWDGTFLGQSVDFIKSIKPPIDGNIF